MNLLNNPIPVLNTHCPDKQTDGRTDRQRDRQGQWSMAQARQPAPQTSSPARTEHTAPTHPARGEKHTHPLGMEGLGRANGSDSWDLKRPEQGAGAVTTNLSFWGHGNCVPTCQNSLLQMLQERLPEMAGVLLGPS